MTIESSSLDYNHLLDQSAGLFCDQVEDVVTVTANRYIDLSKELEKMLLDYADKLKKEEQDINLSLYIFETKDTSADLFGLLEKSLKDDTEDQRRNNFNPILEALIRDFKLEEPEQKEGVSTPADRAPKAGLMKQVIDLIWDRLKRAIGKITKKEDPGDYTGNFLLQSVFIQTMDKNRYLFSELFSCISGLYTNIWEVSKAIHLKLDDLVKADFQIPENEDFRQIDIDFSTVEKLREEVRESLGNLASRLKKDVDERIRELKANQFQLSGDERENHRNYNRKSTARALKGVFRSTASHVENWQRTLDLVTDDWLIELEIAVLKYNILLQSNEFGKFLKTRFREPLDENIQKTSSTVSDLIGVFEKAREKNDNGLINELKAVRTDIKRRLLLKFVPEVRRIITESNIPARIDEFEQSTAVQFTQLSKSRSVKKKPVYSEPTDKFDMDKISPSSLVSFQMMPDFMNGFPLFKQAFTRHLQEVQNRLEEIPEIIDFTLQSTLNYVQEKKDFKEAEKIGLDGIKRTQNKIGDINLLLDNFISTETKNLKFNIEKLIGQLSEITDTESALQIKIRIAKAKAIEKSKEYRKKALDYFMNFLPGIMQVVNRVIAFLRESSIQIRKQFTLEAKKHFVSTDISDYLTETETAVAKLPFIYQRLFKVEPLTTFELYTERKEEIEKIKTAYARWKEGKFAPTVVIGERGWGKTTLVNRFLKMKLTTEEVIELRPDPDMKMEDILSGIIEKTAQKEKAGGEEPFGTQRKIFFLDGLERLFEARIDGFNVITTFLHHVSASNPHIFWIITCHLHTWQYLDKILSISDYFGYHIKLSDFSNDALMKTISRRHNISGYRLMFLPETQKKSIITFKKQADVGDQQLLRDEYFTRMQKIVRGNLSQAFLFWMRSTAYVTEDSVYIEYVNSEYINFLGSMSDSKLLILKYIVLQNGLNLDKFAFLMRLPVEKSRLYLDQLVDDGVLVRKESLYNINPIIYRQVIDQLFMLNILH